MLVLKFLGVCLFFTAANAAKILGVFMTPSYSHQIVFQPIWKELSLRGHQVTVYTPNPLGDKTLTNLTEYDLGFSYEAVKDIDKAGQDVEKIFKIFEDVCDKQLGHPYMQDLIKNVNNETYDLILVEFLWQPMYALKEIYKAPMVGITSVPLTIQGSDSLGMEKHPVMDPDLLLQFSYARTFRQRVLSWGYTWIYRMVFKLKLAPRFNAQIKRHFGQIGKSAFQLMTEVSLVIGNYNFALQNIKPMTPNYIPISGIHVQPQKPLPPSVMMLVTQFLGACLFFTAANAAKILGVFMTPSYSHQIVFQPIWKELSLRGHQVTVYTPNPLKDKSLTNLTEYDLGFSYEAIKDYEKAGQNVDKIFSIFENICDKQLGHPYMQDLIKNVNNETYDLILVEYFWVSMYAFKEVYKTPMVGITSLPLTIPGSDSLGMEKHPVLDPDLLLQFSYAETFKQRLLSWGYTWIYRIVFKLKLVPKYNAQIKRHFGQIAKSAHKLMTEISLVIGNYNFALQNVKPMTTNFIPISGIHVQPQKPLPPNLASFMENLKNDVIYFSLGTNVRASQLHQPTVNRLLSVLGRLPYTILWKYDSDDLPSNLPKNFFVRKWFPQQDILGHPKVKLFITQGGLQSIDESMARKVPMLVIPFHSDQKTNADRCVNLGIAETINIATFTEEEFEEKIQKLLTDESYQKIINKQSLIAGDQPLSSLDTAIYWIEYVLRHDGAPHLRYTAIDLPFYQYYLLDVYLFVGLIFALLYYITKRIAAIVVLTGKVLKRLILPRFFGSSEEKSKKEK